MTRSGSVRGIADCNSQLVIRLSENVAADEEYDLAISQIQGRAGGSQPCVRQREAKSKTVWGFLGLLILLLDPDE
jgi:hypothetical protein